MAATANIQYAWTLFVPEIQHAYGWPRAKIQLAFTIFVIVQTWLAPLEGYFIDKFGPRLIVAFGAISGLLDLPFDYYRQFVLEQRFGFNKMTPGLWLADMV